jgi:hypothetical protein
MLARYLDDGTKVQSGLCWSIDARPSARTSVQAQTGLGFAREPHR